MARLFLGNFAFEQERDPGRNPTRPVLRLEAELAPVWMAIAEEGDEIYCPGQIDDRFWSETSAAGLPQIRSLNQETLRSSRAAEIIPWGWTPRIRRTAAELGLRIQAPDQDVVWRVNSREFADSICGELGCRLPGEGIVRSAEEAGRKISWLLDQAQGWRLKPNDGQAGRGHLSGTASPSAIQLATISRLIDWQGAVHIEPLLKRVQELGVQWEISPSGDATLIGITELWTDERGVYVGSGVNTVVLEEAARENLLEVQQRAIEILSGTGYFGPVGIDAMLYLDSQDLKLRAIQDINARYTMGRMAWEWGARLAGPGAAGRWMHGSESPVAGARALSPEAVDGVRARHRTWWIDAAKQLK